jgi:K+-sensing histidine kinase KdpD
MPFEDRSGGRFAEVTAAVRSILTSRYVITLAAFAGALLFRYVFRESLGLKVPYLQFYPAIIFAAWYGGLGPGVLTTTLSAIVAVYFLLPPAGLAVGDSADQLSLGVFVATGMLLFARPPKPNRMPIDLVPLVRTTASLLGEDPALRGVDVEVAGTAPPVSADADMLRVVFQNLFINSAHAMQGKGRIRVAVEPVDMICQIAFIDGGPGIPPDIRDKIFTPFFATKTRGSGLGLPTVKRLIEAHNGQVAIDCPPAGGTAVIIRLPMGAS